MTLTDTALILTVVIFLVLIIKNWRNDQMKLEVGMYVRTKKMEYAKQKVLLVHCMKIIQKMKKVL